MIVGDVVEKFLGIESSTEEEGEVPVGGFDDEGDLVDGFSAVKTVAVF